MPGAQSSLELKAEQESLYYTELATLIMEIMVYMHIYFLITFVATSVPIYQASYSLDAQSLLLVMPASYIAIRSVSHQHRNLP